MVWPTRHTLNQKHFFVLDSVFVMESAMRHFFVRAEIRKSTNWEESEVDADYAKAAEIRS
jgi:hypothetical protein